MLIKGEHVPWTTIGELVAGRAAEKNDALWVEIAGQRMSWQKVDALSDRVAAAFARMGLVKGDRVTCFMANCLEELLIWFGAVKLGAIWNPINAALRGEDLAYILGDVAPKILVTDTDNGEKIDALPERRDAIPHRLVIGAARAGYAPFEALLGEEAPPPKVEVLPSDPAVIIYTGGTTGLPKGALLPHFAWICAGFRLREAFNPTPDDVYFSTMPLYHIGASMGGVLAPLFCNMCSVVDRSFSLRNFWRRIRETEATLTDLIGTVMMLLYREPPSPADRDHKLRAALAIVSQIPAHMPAAFTERFGVKLVNLYSLTEAGGLLALYTPLDAPKIEANGKSWGWSEVRIVDERDEPLPPRQIGQIVLRPSVPYSFMLGYYNNPVRTLECYANLWFHTGDLGYLDEEGWLYFTGRHAHWLRRRGENISAQEVENIVSRYPGIAEIIVVGAPSELGEEEVKAFIVAEPGVTIDPVALVRWCEERMAGFKVPRFIEFVTEFPRSIAKQEVERHKLRAMPNTHAWDSEKVLGRRRQGESRAGA